MQAELEDRVNRVYFEFQALGDDHLDGVSGHESHERHNLRHDGYSGKMRALYSLDHIRG